MTKKEKADYAAKYLAELYPNQSTHLDNESPFELLVAVILSAQCTDKRVNLVTPALFKVAGTSQKMAKLDIAKLEKLIYSCGFYKTKAANLSKLAQILTKEYKGEVPQDISILETLPGVGHKTASVVMMQAFGVPTFPVDTHIHRLATRWGLTNGKNVVQTEKDLKKLFPKSLWNSIHLQIIQYGRDYCQAYRCKTKETMCHLCEKFGTKITKIK